MTQDDCAGKTAFAETDVRVTNPAGDEAHKRFISARPFHLEPLDFERLAGLPQHSRSDRE
jgi:hypothetical protein